MVLLQSCARAQMLASTYNMLMELIRNRRLGSAVPERAAPRTEETRNPWRSRSA
jgi:hypothetical protein